ncbi:MAG: glycosyltransferase family 4 protein [Burkholderiaceae bacterium]|nr:glycosyltransferase family 4 protein [Burkholderiaceae bacterium]
MRRDQANPADGARLRRLCLVISTLGAGGAERVLSTLANWWAAAGHSITLVTLSDGSDDFYWLDERIERIALGVMRPARRPHEAVFQNLRRICALREAINATRPDVVVSFISTVNVLTLIATMGLGVPTIVSERVDPRTHAIGRAWSLLRNHWYSRAYAVVVQTRSVAECISEAMRLNRCVVIPNPLAPPLLALDGEISAQPLGTMSPTIAAMGRLVDQKGFDLLIEAFALTRPRESGWRLVIIGDGPRRKALEAVARKLGVDDIVEFAGRVHRPETVLRTAKIFVMSSRYEGFPNALLEAMALGIACVATDCRSGPADIVRHGIDGLLVPSENVAALATTIRSLMDDDILRTGLAMRAREVRARFSVDRIAAQWDALLVDAAGAPT